MSKDDTPKPAPVVEAPAPGAEQPVFNPIGERIRQQEILAELGVSALQGIGFEELIELTVRMVAEGLNAELSKVLEYVPGEKRLILRAGVGWDPKLIGVASVGADLASPAGFALSTGKPVISNHLEHEERFRTPDLLRAYGVRRAINVILQGEGRPFGVLEVDSRSDGEFGPYDIAFLQGAANILGMAIERQRYERSLHEAVEQQKVLINEINHRVKNSLQLVASMFSLQATETEDPVLARSLQDALGRITAIARIHERLYRTSDIRNVDLSDYISDVCKDLAAIIPGSTIDYRAPEPIAMATDRAVRVALLLTELVTNAVKHAFPDGARGIINVEILSSSADDTVTLSVRDDGIGMPADFNPEKSGGLGLRIIRVLLNQMRARLEIERLPQGTNLLIVMPLRAPS